MKNKIILLALSTLIGARVNAQGLMPVPAPAAPISVMSGAGGTMATGGTLATGASGAAAAGNTTISQTMQKTCTGSAMGAISCTYMVLAAAQAVMDLLGSGNGKAVTAATTDAATTGTATTPATSTADGGLAQKLQQAENDAIKDAAGKGVVLSPDLSSVTLPNGSTVPTSSLGTSDGLQAAGLTADEASQVLANAAAAAAKAKSQYGVASMGTEDGGGGGRALNSRGGNGDDDDGNSKLKSLLSAMNKGRKPASMSGLSKKLGNTGENIGVAGDDIFQMITRQYQRKDAQNTFLKTP